MKIATWNVNSLRVRLPHLLDWLGREQPDAVCLQETKVEDALFPAAELERAGYVATFAGQKTYNGVAILTRGPVQAVCAALPGADESQKRFLAVSFGDLRLINVYVPNGQSVGSDKFAYKLDWLRALHDWLRTELPAAPRLALLGDFNIAPEDRDVHDPAAWAGGILCSDPERAAFGALQALGLQDAFRRFKQADQSFSWWDYRMGGFRRNQGLRIDHILLSPPLAETCRACRIDREPRALERPSDHAPVLAEF